MRKLYVLIQGAFLACVSVSAIYAQAPGGVSTGLAAWYKGDLGLTENSWLDQSGNAYDLERASPPLGASLINFNPVASFEGITAHQFYNLSPKLLWPVGNTTPTTYYYVAKNKAAIANTAAFGIGASGDNTGFHSGQQATTGAITTRGTVSFANNTGSAMVPTPPNWEVSQPNQGLNLVRTGFDGGGATGRNYIAAQGLVEAINATNVNPTYANTVAFRIGSSGANSVFWNGNIAEVVVFSGKHDAAEYNKVETYLALKYGISKQGDYVDADDNIIYSDAIYNNNIAGIGRDDASGLHQKQAMSQNAGPQLLMGSGNGLFDTNADNTNDLANGNFLVWGDNGLNRNLNTPLVYAGGSNGETNFRFEAIWKTQNTNGSGNVTVAWPKGINNLYLVQSLDETFDDNDVFTPMTDEVTVNGVVYNTATVSSGSGYFTLAGFAFAPGGVTGPDFWVRSDDAGDIGTAWKDHSQNEDDIPAVGAWTVSPPDGSHNFHPYTTGYTTSKYFFNPLSVMNPNGNAVGPIANYTVFSAVRPTSLTTAGRITGNDDDNNYAAEPGFSITNNGLPRHYEFSNTTTATDFSTAFNVNAANVFSVLATNGTGNGGSSSNPGGEKRLGLNGAYEVTDNFATGNRFQLFGNKLYVGYGSWDINGAFPGDIMEVVWYNRELTAEEQSRVNTYLAIKNGVTLTEDYLSSTSDVVFSQTTHAGYTNNIFGLGRNNISSLHQKQAKSTNPGQKLVIGNGNSLFDTNAENTNDLTDGQFLMVGDNGLKQSLFTALANPAAPGGEVNYRFDAVWKVQNTNTLGTVVVAWPKRISNLHLIHSLDENIDASDDFIAMTDEVTIDGVAYNMATVTLSDGDYFTFAGFAYAPGGVIADLRVWLKADEGFLPDTWRDFSIHENDYTQTNTNRQPFVATRQFNFNPMIDFGGSASADGRFMVVPSGKPFSANGLSGTFFTTTLTRTGGTSGYRDILGFNGTTTTANLTNANEPAVTKLDDNIVLYSSITSAFPNEYPNNELLLTDVSYTVNVAGINYGLNGRDASTTQTRTAAGSLQANGSILGSQGEVNNGLIGEVIAYERDLTPEEKQRVRSYVGIKYGATLRDDIDEGFDYLDAQENTIWSGTAANLAYHNNVFGIARDEVSGLHQKQSNSISPSQKLIIGHGGPLFDSNAANTNDLTNGQFLMVGDNGLKQQLTTPLAYTAGVNGEANFRFEAIWKAQNTNNVGNVTVAWPKGISNLYLVQSPDETVDVSDTFTPMTSEITVNGVVYNTATITIADGTYFTFAGFAFAPGGVVGGLSYWYRADKDVANTGAGTDVTSWTDMFQGAVSSQLGTNGFPKYVEGAENYFNYNPGLTFTANNQSLGTLDVRTLSSLDYDVFTFTKEGMTGGGNPRFFSSIVDNNVTSGSIDYWDALGLFPDGRIERITNAYTDRYFLNPGNINFDPNVPSIMYHTFTDISMSKGLNGAENGSEHVNNNARGYMNGGHVFGSTQFSSNGSDNAGFVGDIGETIVYGAGSLTETERRRIDSYLAIKYGITLARVGTNPYLASDETAVWDGSIAASYNNNIFGLAKDDIGAFEQNVSRSVNAAGDGLTVATTDNFTLPNSDASRTGFSNDKTYFLLGDNNVTTTSLVDLTVAGNDVQRIERIWLAQRTNTPGALYFEADLSAYGSLFTEGNSVYMLVADDAGFTANITQTPGIFTNGKWVFNRDFDGDGAVRYITFAEVTVGCTGPDSDGDGVPDMCDLDADNDGILNSDECGGENLILNGNFTTLPSSPGALSPSAFAAATDNNWTFASTGTGVDAEITWDNITGPFPFGNGIRFQRDGQTQSLIQAISGWQHGGNPQLMISKIAANNSNPSGNSSTLIVSYAGVEYVRIVTTNGIGSGVAITYSNGASSSLTSFTTGVVYDNWVVNLPFDIPASGDLEFEYLGGPADSDDFSLGDVVVTSCGDTDGDGIADYLDLDSDNDGCPDAIEGDGNFELADLAMASGTIALQSPNQNFGIGVDANGIPTAVGATGQGVGQSKDNTTNDCMDTDGDGVPDRLDLDSDNDGILDADECGEIDGISNGTFPNSGGNTDAVPGWTVGGTYNGVWGSGTGRVNLNANGLEFRRDAGTVTTLEQDLTNIIGKAVTINLNDLYWVKTYVAGSASRFVLTVSYGGVIYATIDGTDSNAPSVVANNGASVSLSALPTVTATPAQDNPIQSAKTNLSITLPSDIPSSGTLLFTFTAGTEATEVKDFGMRSVAVLGCGDTDGDGIPDYLDLDSDNDGCPDAVEGDENVNPADLNPDGSINVGANGGVDSDGIPSLVNAGGEADDGDDVGQGIGSALDPGINACPTYCVQPGATGAPTEFTQVGISDREGFGAGWPESIPNGFVAIESETSGFVITRVQQVSDIADPQEGMLVYEIEDQCLKLYNGTTWNCIQRSCNE